MTFLLLHNVGDERHPNYNTHDQIKKSSGTLTFDGIYRNVYENQDLLYGRDVILFVMGNYVGGDNEFDLPNVPKLEKYCTWKEIEELVDKYGAELGWHTWNHPDLTTLSKEEIMHEITPPFPMESFAYPYGRYNDLVIECLKEAGYKRAFSVNKTDGTIWTIPRPYLS